MDKLQRKRQREQEILAFMIGLYCRRQHKSPRLCPACQELLDYACDRTAHCPFMATKTFCARCKVHCYKPEMRRRIRSVMGYSGPRMLLYHPLLAIRHYFDTKKHGNP